MTATRSLRRTCRRCRRRRRFSREAAHENSFDYCSLSAGADVYGLWAERVSSFYPPAATAESRGNPVPGCGQRIALRRVLLPVAAPWLAAAALRLFRATCADTACWGALQHPCVSPDHGTGQHHARAGRLRVVDSGLPPVPRKFQGHLRREACDAGINCVAVRDIATENRWSKCRGRPLGLCGQRLPELNLIPIQVIDPGKATVGFIHSFGVDLDSLLF